MRFDRYDRRWYTSKRMWLREDLVIGEKVLILAERIKRKDALGRFYKRSVQKIP